MQEQLPRRTEWRNRNVLDVHEDFEHRATQQSSRVAAFETRSNQKGLNYEHYL